MKKSTLLPAMAAVALLWMCNAQPVNAQMNANHVFHVNTWYMVPGQDSVTRAERNAVLKEYFTKVTMKNEFILHEWMMTHFFTEDSREFVTIAEYASWADITKAEDRDDELARQAWPDAQKRQEFMKKMNSYFTYHKDAVYSGLPNLSK